jgi:hypothetical protein
MNSFYELIGRLVVWFVRSRYRRQLRIAAALGGGLAVLAAVVAYAIGSRRDVEEG